jgi:Holliday junction resolvase RusA-like endonuclease
MRPIANWATQKVRQVEEVADSKAWRAAVVNAMIPTIADQQVDRWVLREGFPWGGPVAVSLGFVMPWEGASRQHPRAGWPTPRRYGDVDKLTRNVLDALGAPKKKGDLCAGLYQDDSLVCRLDVTKRFVTKDVPEDEAGVLITAWELE